jgi:hypothetical protein
MFDLPPGFWDDAAGAPPPEPAGQAPPPAAATPSRPVAGGKAHEGGTAPEADSPLSLVQELFPGRIISIDRPPADTAGPLAEDEAFGGDELPDDED